MPEGLRSAVEEILRRRPALVFLGNYLRGDDTAGLLVGARVKASAEYPYVFVCEEGLENCLHELRRAGVKVALIVDAVDAGLEPGSIVLSRLDAAYEALPSTHKLPLRLVAEYLGLEEVYVLGIQVQNLEVSQGVSRPVAESARRLAEALLEALGRLGSQR